MKQVARVMKIGMILQDSYLPDVPVCNDAKALEEQMQMLDLEGLSF